MKRMYHCKLRILEDEGTQVLESTFADDMVIMPNSEDDLQYNLNEEFNRINTVINIKKNKTMMVVNRWGAA